MKFVDLEFTDYANLNDNQINKVICELLDFDEIEFIFYWIEFKSISHFKGTKQYKIRVHDLGDQ